MKKIFTNLKVGSPVFLTIRERGGRILKTYFFMNPSLNSKEKKQFWIGMIQGLFGIAFGWLVALNNMEYLNLKDFYLVCLCMILITPACLLQYQFYKSEKEVKNEKNINV